MAQHSLLELNEFLKRVIQANLPDLLWVTAEITQISQSRGHFYIDLVEKDAVTQQIVAQSQAIIWAGTFYRIKKKIGKGFKEVLNTGNQVLIQVSVEFNERYGLSLIIENLDPSYTLGQLELKRQEILETLEKEGLLSKNTKQSLPLVPQRIAVISSTKAAGLQDFMQHLTENPYGYAFKITTFNAAMQGQFVEKEVGNALSFIAERKQDFDAVVITRGGGSKLDLAGFDSLKLCRLIANAPLPILTGIGHDIDTTLPDFVAHTALKTPTAVADFLIERLAAFEGQVQLLGQQLENLQQGTIHQQKLLLQNFKHALNTAVQTKLATENRMLNYTEVTLPKVVQQRLKSAHSEVALLEKTCELLSPEQAFRRGFSITTDKEGKPIQEGKNLQKGDRIYTYFSDGKIESEVQ